jgi:hypothetical protein
MPVDQEQFIRPTEQPAQEGCAGEKGPPQEKSAPVKFCISLSAFLRSMLAIAWGAFRHPFSTTYVDISTGESVHVS